MEEPTVPEVVKSEGTRQFIILVFGVITVILFRKLNDPDAVKTAKMWTALTVKRWADRQAVRFSDLATTMANVYNGEKL